jgi:hypothetical protein
MTSTNPTPAELCPPSETLAVCPIKPGQSRFSFTFFSRGTKNPAGERKLADWGVFFEKVLLFGAEKRADIPKEKLPAWSPAVFTDDKRAKHNVENVTALVLDYDNTWIELADGKAIKQRIPEEELVTIERAVAAWKGCMLLVHTSSSHTSEWPRFRVVVPFSRPVTPDEYTIIWEWAAEHLEDRGQAIDGACKDPSRLWFLPARRSDNYEAVLIDGQHLDVDAILATKGGVPC